MLMWQLLKGARDRTWRTRTWTASWMLVGTQLRSDSCPGAQASTHGTRIALNCRSHKQASAWLSSGMHSAGAVITMGPADMFL